MENPVIIVGAQHLGHAAMEIFQSRDIVVYCFLDEDEKLHNTEINDVSVLGSPTDDGFLKYIGKKCEAFVAVEDPELRKEYTELLMKKRKVMPVNAIHNRAFMAASATLGHGNFIHAGAMIDASVEIGSHCIVQLAAAVGAGCKIADYAQIGANVTLGNRVKLEKGAIIGAGATVATGKVIGKGAQIAPGSVLLTDADAGEQYFGNPAKKV